MTEIAATAIPLHQTPGKRNMASAAFAELRAARAGGRAPEGNELSFADLVDTINPLQHIPVVSDIYRHLTGDALSPQSRVAGGILFGGVIGGVVSVLSLAIAGGGEKGVGDVMLASVLGGEEEPAAKPQLAEAPKPAEAAPEAPLVTASLAPSRPVQAPAKPAPAPAARAAEAVPASPASPASMSPSLSPEAFNALLGAFSDPAPLRDAEARLTMGGGGDESDEAMILSAPGGAALADSGLMAAMQQAMDKYQAMQSVTR